VASLLLFVLPRAAKEFLAAHLFPGGTLGDKGFFDLKLCGNSGVVGSCVDAGFGIDVRMILTKRLLADGRKIACNNYP
jgi:hypothetical protein